MLWFRHKSHLVRMRKTWWFCLKYQFRTTESPPEIVHPSLKISRFWSAKTWLEMIWLPMKTTQLWLPQKHLEMVWLPLKNTRLRLPHNTPGCGPASGWKTSSFGHHKKRRLVTWLPVINNRSRSLQEHLETVCRPLKNFATKKKTPGDLAALVVCNNATSFPTPSPASKHMMWMWYSTCANVNLGQLSFPHNCFLKFP